jgi:hypothetical protein
VTVGLHDPATSPGLIFVGPSAVSAPPVTGQTGPLIVDDAGQPVWFAPLSSPYLAASDFHAETYRGRPVLTWWQGTIAGSPGDENLPGGDPEPGACFYIVDDHYDVVRTIKARDGFVADQHEFTITPRDSALYSSSKIVPADLSAYGGPANGYLDSPEIQEVDIDTGRVLFRWKPADHVDLADSEMPASSAASSNGIWDAYHLNSIQEIDGGKSLLVSLRNTSTIYKVDKATGKIVWRLGGKHSDFTFADEGATFAWQHDARLLPHHRISMFDDECCADPKAPAEHDQPSHGLILDLDEHAKTASTAATFFRGNPPATVPTQGSLQVLPDGHVFVGWGAGPWYTEYRGAGNTAASATSDVVYDATMPGQNQSYRAFRQLFTATPSSRPDVAVDRHGDATTVYASWNGSTETARWRVLAGPDREHLAVAADDVPRTGFETAVVVHTAARSVQVDALDAHGHRLASSRRARVR